MLRRRCDPRVFKPLPIEIIARQKVASLERFEPGPGYSVADSGRDGA